MIETDYDYTSGYHRGDLVEQDAKAFLGIWKRLKDVPLPYRLSNFERKVDAEEAWEAFEIAELSDISTSTRKYRYGKAKREWWSYCEQNDVHPALATPDSIEDHIAAQKAGMSTYKSVHDIRFRPLYLWYRWMAFHTDYDHTYNPTLMAVLFRGEVYRVWKTRLSDRKQDPTVEGSRV
ncbi:hypothetical protein SY89_02687 [Halolamina pelagica]|uniref:Uncharacterized protein n=1 Tax=Halolamina pelagica TaxID=699431 RepID=A0A0P7HXT5_9EURY|nr:hypothetical protein [Halolamina pelagica]KPN31930.1 hypothetical protein SY89_02687 [Halolamina pelagica]